MAKDGTRRGGARIGAGRKKKSVSEKIIEGKFPANASNREIKEFEIPSPREYLSAEQKTGSKTYAAQIYEYGENVRDFSRGMNCRTL